MTHTRCINVLGGLYLTAEPRPLAGAATQPRRLAVLAMLVVAGERAVKREQFLTYLWPDLDEDRGRHALTQSLYTLRRALDAEELFLGQQDLRLNPDLITSDYAEFHSAVRSGAPEQAVECYRGRFLEGFHLPRAEYFERWAEEQRDGLEHTYGQVLEAAARRAAEQRDFTAAVGYLKRRAAQDPLNGKVAVKLMEALAAQGAVVAALQHAKAHELLVRQELELPPDPEVTALAARIRAVPRPAATVPPASVMQPPQASSPELAAPVAAPSLPAPDSPSPKQSRSRVPGVIALVAVATVSLVVSLGRRRSPPPPESGPPVVAVGLIADYSGKQPGGLGQPLADMLATNLARASGFRVISNARMLELIQQLRGGSDTAGLASAAARQAGAAELIDGSLYAIAPNRYRLDLRRVDLRSGAVIRAYKVEGADLFALVDSLTPDLVPDLGGSPPAGSVAQTSTKSFSAYEQYEEGLRRFYDGDMAAAERRFGQAIELDSTFAQAAFYYALATTSGSRSETLDRLRRAVALSPQAGDRERLIIQAEWAGQNSSPALAAIAETLMIRYPEEVDGYYYAGVGANLLGNYREAEAPFRRVLLLDSLGFSNVEGRRCRVCEAYDGLGYSYSALDAQSRGRALIHEWVRRQPSAARAWRALASAYAGESRLDSALAALRVADSLEPTNLLNRRYLISVRSSLEDYPEAEQLLRTEIEAAPLTYRPQAKWDLAVILRQTGRLREALPLAHAYRMEIKERLLPGAAPYNALLEGQILFELGQYRAAAALFDSIAVGEQGDLDPSFRARERVWAWVHEADAVAQLGDSARLRFLADSMEILGRIVAHARDRQLHAHVRGLLAQLQGRDAEAADWFRRAIVSPVIGFTRSNYELSGVYLRTHRPADAIGILRAALHGGTDGSSLYISRTELEGRLAQAFDSAGHADSARFYYGKVIRAWEHADRQFWPRRDSIVVATRRLEAAGRR